MKSTILIACLIIPFWSQAQGWIWGNNQKTLNKSLESYAVAMDGAGNVFGGGSTYDTGKVDFGNGVILTLPPRFSIVDDRLFYVKYNNLGLAQWAGAATGINWLNSMTTDAAGNLILFGSFHSTQMQIGSIILDNPVGGTNRFFLAKINPAGTVLWAVGDGNVAGGFHAVFGYYATSSGGVTTDTAGNIYITTTFYKPTITLGATTLTNTDASGTTGDVLVAKYSAGGVLVWAKSFGGSSNDLGYNIAIAPGGSVYVTGEFHSPTIILGSDTLTNPYGVNTPRAFIARCSPTGTALWGQGSGGPLGAAGIAIGADKVGGIYVTGAFKDSSISFGRDTVIRPYPAAVPLVAQYLARYSTADTVTWARAFGSSIHGVYPYGLAVVPCGQVWVTAGDTGAVEINGSLHPAAVGPDPLFLAGFDPSGRLVSYAGIGTGGDDQASIACDSVGNVAICGDMMGSTSVDMGADTITNPLYNEIFFVGKYGAVKDTFITSTDTSVCGIASLLLSGVTGSSSYRWSDGSSNPTLPVSGSGSYYVHSIACGVDNVDTFHVTFLTHPCNEGIDEIVPVTKIELYPNPVQNSLTVAGSGKITSVCVLNLLGQRVCEQTFDHSKVEVDVSRLKPGIYFIRVNGGEMSKFVKE